MRYKEIHNRASKAQACVRGIASAALKTDSGDAKSVAQALRRDNLNLNGLRITTNYMDKRIITDVESKSMKSLLSTLDDIISCQILAEDAIWQRR